MATKGPGLFSDIGKRAKDLLTKDYTYDQKLTVSTVSSSGVGLTSTAVKKGGLYTLDVNSVYKYKNTNVDIKVDTESNISTTLTVFDVLPSTKLVTSVKLPDYNSGKVEVQYFHENASFATAVGMKPSPVVEFSGTAGAQGIAFGAEAGFDTATGKFTKYSAGIGVTKPDYHAAIVLADKGDTIKVSGVYHLDDKKKTSAVAELTRRLSANENTLTVGGLYTVDPQTSVKARLNNTGKLAALLQHEVKPKSLLTISGEFDTKALDRPPKFGLALALKP
ncbi:mitochondrial outer membrane protein porin 5 [Oryza brachyantha]|uniref:Mitochondrial outer membrane protein porin 5 n=1 Tax=Oryza brachyantha TaxID=4533 RepID=J3LL42_ORYBR|nr:mitochondrial outer membrane protein porin 5 [Oryza brachyantha]